MNIKFSRLVNTVRYERIVELIELLLDYWPESMSLLLGESPVPNIDEVHELMNATRAALPEDYKATQKNSQTEAERKVQDYEYFCRSVEFCGGFEHITQTAREFREIDSKLWNIVADHIRYVENFPVRNKSRLGYIASKYHTTPRTIIKYRKRFPGLLALLMLMPNSGKQIAKLGDLRYVQL